MKLLSAVIISLLFLTVSGAATAGPRDGTGVGIILGEPTGLSVKKWTGATQAIDFGVAWSFSENNSFHFHTDYLIHSFDILKTDDPGVKIPVYFGLGGRLKLSEEGDEKGRNDEDSLIGIRIPFGVSYLFRDAPLDIFMEIVPVLDIAPDTEFDLNGAIGARFYF